MLLFPDKPGTLKVINCQRTKKYGNILLCETRKGLEKALWETQKSVKWVLHEFTKPYSENLVIH